MYNGAELRDPKTQPNFQSGNRTSRRTRIPRDGGSDLANRRSSSRKKRRVQPTEDTEVDVIADHALPEDLDAQSLDSQDLDGELVPEHFAARGVEAEKEIEAEELEAEDFQELEAQELEAQELEAQELKAEDFDALEAEDFDALEAEDFDALEAEDFDALEAEDFDALETEDFDALEAEDFDALQLDPQELGDQETERRELEDPDLEDLEEGQWWEGEDDQGNEDGNEDGGEDVVVVFPHQHPSYDDDSDSDAICMDDADDVLACDDVGLERGVLLLPEDVAEKLNKFLRRNSDDSFYLECIERIELIEPGKQKPTKPPSKKKIIESSQIDTAQIQGTESAKKHHHTQRSLSWKRLPEWIKRFCLIIERFLRQPIMQHPYSQILLEEPSPTHPDHQLYLASIYPGQPISLKTIVSKLENNMYETALQVLNDVYCVWICGFRFYQPGSPRWMHTQAASEAFFIHIAHEPFRDDFHAAETATPPKGKPTAVPTQQHSNLENLLRQLIRSTRKQQKLSSGDKDFKDFKNFESSVSHFGGSSKRRHKKRRSKSKLQPLHEIEREALSNVLQKLTEQDHLDMYNHYKLRARWREDEDMGIELDEKESPPEVLREMIAWGKERLEQQQPSKSDGTKRKRKSDHKKHSDSDEADEHQGAGKHELTEIKMFASFGSTSSESSYGHQNNEEDFIGFEEAQESEHHQSEKHPTVSDVT